VSGAKRWLAVILASIAATIGAVAFDSGVAAVPVLWFLAVCPGMPYARMLRAGGDDDPLLRWVSAVGLSLAMAAVVAEGLLLAGAFTGMRTIAILSWIAVAGALIEYRRARRVSRVLEPAAD
jgi:hypothetical protein